MRARGVWPRCSPSMLTSAHGFTMTRRPPGRGTVAGGTVTGGSGVAAATAAGVGDGTGEGGAEGDGRVIDGCGTPARGGAVAGVVVGTVGGATRSSGESAGDGRMTATAVVGGAVRRTAVAAAGRGPGDAR